MVLNDLIYIFIFIFGVCIGSFLNCVIYRTELQEKMPAGPGRKAVSFLRGKSFCPNCKHTLSWQDLFPVFSFLFLGGKCRYCRKKISAQYPLVELATGILFVLILSFGDVGLHMRSPASFLSLTFLFYIASVLIIIFVYDLKHYIIPDKILFPAIIIALIYRLFDQGNLIRIFHSSEKAVLFGNWEFGIGNYILASIIASVFFLTIFLISKGRAMGFGDVKLAVLMGLLLGVNNVLVALFLAFFFGAIIGIILMALKKKGLRSEIPFGPFLITGTFMAMLYGNQIVQWYTSLFKI